MNKRFFWPLCSFILGVGVTAAIWFAVEGWTKLAHDDWHTAALLGSLLVVVGWIVTSANTLRHNELDLTLRVLDKRRSDQESTRRWSIINNYKPGRYVLKPPGPGADYPSDHEIYDAVWNEINSCEYISIGGIKGIYDDAMLRNELESDFLLLHRFSKEYIKWEQANLHDPAIWENFDKLCQRWGGENQTAAKTRSADVWDSGVILLMSAIADAVAVYLRWRK